MNEITPRVASSSLLTEMPAKRTRKRKAANASAPVPKRMRLGEARLLEAERGVRIVFGQKLWDTLVRRAGISKMTPAELLREPLQALLKEIEDESSAFVASFDVLLEKQAELISAEILAAARPQETDDFASAKLDFASSGEVHETIVEHPPVLAPRPASPGIPDLADLDLASCSEVQETRVEQALVPVPSSASEDVPEPDPQPPARIRTHWRDMLAGLRRRAPVNG